MVRRRNAVITVVVIVLVAGPLIGYEFVLGTTGRFVAGTSVDTNSDILAENCNHILGDGALELQVVYDVVGIPVHGESINAVGMLGCEFNGNAQTQVAYLNNFTIGSFGWLSPVFPSHTVPQGNLNFMVKYLGSTYRFTAAIPPIGVTCVTLRVPSGGVSTRTADV